MKRKIGAFFLVFCLFSSFSAQIEIAAVESHSANYGSYGNDYPGGPVQIMPPQ